MFMARRNSGLFYFFNQDLPFSTIESIDKINKMRKKFFFISFFLLFLFGIPLITLADCPPQNRTETITQSVVQYKCTKGACGGEIEFRKRTAERKCKRECTDYYKEVCEEKCTTDESGATTCTTYCWCECSYTVCGNWQCDPWKYSPSKEGEVTATYDSSKTPWLVCTYKYDKLLKNNCSWSYRDKSGCSEWDVSGSEEYDEKKRAGVTYPYDKIKCDENECREVDEVTWFPPVFDSDSKDFFDYCVAHRSFFDVAQVTCWGKCLDASKGPHYFGGSINPTRKIKWYDGSEHTESEEQSPSEVRLPTKFGWELNMQKSGMEEWEMAIDWAKEKCKKELEKGRACPYPSPPYSESEIRRIIREMFKEIYGVSDGEKKFKEDFEIKVDDDLYLSRGLGAGSFSFKQPVKKFLPLAEGQEIPEWQTPGSKKEEVYWTRKDMFDYFDYYFLSKTGYSENEVRYGFSGEIEGKRLFVYSPSQDSKKDFLWVEYKDPNENFLTKQLRSNKMGGTNGPCAITPFQNHNFFVTPCCSSDPENCSPQKPDWNFYALGPEIKSILGIRTEEIRKVYPFHLQSITKEEGKIYRFIDIDWDRTWPSELKRKEILEKQGSNKVKYDYFYTGMVSFDQFDGGLNECEKECKKKCDRKCLDICENQCIRECESTFKKEEELKKCKDDCYKNFEKFKKERCPNCKAEEKNMGCVVCADCAKEYECTENCIRDCYRDKAARTGRLEEEFKDCDEVCGENPYLDLVAARGECNKLKSARDRKICEICQTCSYKVDYVDVEWCSNFSGPPLLTSFYKERKDINFPLEFFLQRKPKEECEDVKTPSPCKSNPCECYKYTPDGKEIFARNECQTTFVDEFLPHPKIRIPPEILKNLSTSTFECTPYPYEKVKCFGVEPLQIYDQFKDSKLVGSRRQKFEKLKVTRDIYAEFGDFEKKQTYSIPISLYDEKPWSPQPWWEQEKFSPFFSSLVSNTAIVGVENKGSGLRWDFRITSLPKIQLCDYSKERCFGEKEREYPFCYEIRKETLSGYLAPEKEFDKEKNELGIYRTESLQLPAVDRIFSYRLKIKSGGSFVEYLPKSATQALSGGFYVWEIWNSLPPLENALERLNKEFLFEIYPCGDEIGFFCPNNYVEQKVRITGEPPPFPFKEEDSGPPPPKKIRIPHYFNWDASLGAASYWLRIGGEQAAKIFFHKDILAVGPLKSNFWVDQIEEGTPVWWQVKTCADLCSKDSLQCGEWSEEIGPVVGYYLNPPFEMLSVVQFSPNEEITLWWKPIAKGTDCTHLKIIYKGGGQEKRKDCIEKVASNPDEGYIILDQIFKGDMDGKLTVSRDLFPTSTEVYEDKATGIKTNICLGNYYYQVKYCTGENCYKKKNECETPEECKKKGENYLDCVDCYYSAECQEAGPWSYLSSFEIVTKKYGGGGRGGFGTCKNIIPCTKCNFSDIPKIISNIISCILWTLSPIAMIFLLLYTGIRIYFSFGSPEAIESAKSIWKAVGIGWLIMLFSWLIVNLIGKTFKMPGW
jgi:hypothetical protein